MDRWKKVVRLQVLPELSALAPAVLRQDRHLLPKQSRAGRKLRSDTSSETAAMTKWVLYMAPIALIGLMATEARAVPAVWSGGIARNIAAATADAKDAPLVLVGGGGRGGGGGFRGGGGGGYRGGAAGGGVNRGNYAGRGSW